MKIEDIKNEMLKYKDYYGGDLINIDDIKKAKTKKELSNIIKAHEKFMENMLCDALGSLKVFENKVGLNF
jgi:hypothetical protein